jgi:hypothetical protein
MAIEPSDKTLGEWNIRAKGRIMGSAHKVSEHAIVTVGAISFEQQTLKLMVNSTEIPEFWMEIPITATQLEFLLGGLRLNWGEDEENEEEEEEEEEEWYTEDSKTVDQSH